MKKHFGSLLRNFSKLATKPLALSNSKSCSNKSKPISTFYRRELPSNLIPFTSSGGKQMFINSIAQGFAENYFPLVGNFTTQSEPEYCALGSLAMVLNALEIDPKKNWKGVWRWYSDNTLECAGSNISRIKEKGVTFKEFSCLAKCNGLDVIAKRGDQFTLDEFINDLKIVCSNSDMHMVISFSRKSLNQTGDGHFSPIGCYSQSDEMALVLDTARFKYPSYFAKTNLLFEAMQPIDKETGLPRGYFILKRKEPSNSSILTSKLGITDSKASSLFCSDIPYLLSIHKPETISDAFRVIIDACEYCSVIQTFQIREASKDLAAPVEIQLSNLIQHDLQVKELFKEIQKHPLNQHVKSAIEHSSKMKNILISPQTIDLTTIFFLASPIQMYKTVSPGLFQQLKLIKNLDTMPILLKGEVERISNQLSTLMKI